MATNLSLACLLLHSDSEHKAGNMSSWWGPTWISVRWRGKREWTSSPVGSAQTQRRVQTKPPTSATPIHPCQVKTTPSDPQIDRQLAYWRAGVQRSNYCFSLPFFIWSCEKYFSNHSLLKPPPSFGTCASCPSACIDGCWHQLPHLWLMTGGFFRCLSACLHFIALQVEIRRKHVLLSVYRLYRLRYCKEISQLYGEWCLLKTCCFHLSTDFFYYY